MTHYLNFIEEEDDDIDDIEEVEEDDEEEVEDDEVVIKKNKRFIPRNYTFYKIHKNGCESYVGSTVNLYNRKALHKNFCNDKKSIGYNFPIYQYMRDNGGYDTFEFEILDKKFVCKVDAEIYEAELMRLHKSTLNVKRNYTEDDIKEKIKSYRNTEKSKQYQKKYREKRKQIHLTINLNINLPQD